MSTQRAEIRSLACALPQRRVGNDAPEFAALASKLPRGWWEFWGVNRRPFMDLARETADSMALSVCRRALDDAGLAAADLDLVLVNSSSPVLREGERLRLLPRVSATLCTALGAAHAQSQDVEMACLSFLLLLQQAYEFVRSGMYSRVLVCSVETASPVLDFSSIDSTMFGDGAAAAVIARGDNGGELLASAWGSTGAHYPVATLQRRAPAAGGAKAPYFTLAPDGRTRMMGFVPQTVPSVVKRALAKAGMRSSDIAQFVFHQPSRIIIDAWAFGVGEACGDIGDRYPVTVSEHGCLGSVALPSNLHVAITSGLVRPGQHIVLAGLGIGWSYGAQVWRWGHTRVSPIVPTVGQSDEPARGAT